MHFVTGKPSTNPLHLDYIQTVFEHTPLPKKTPNVLQSKLDRSNRVKGREENKSKSAAALALLQLSDCENVCQEHEQLITKCTVESSTQTDVSFVDLDALTLLSNSQCETIERQKDFIQTLLSMNTVLNQQTNTFSEELERIQQKISVLENDNELLLEKVKLCFSHRIIEENDIKTQNYTGLPIYDTFIVVFNHAAKYVQRNSNKTKISLKDEMVVTLVKLRHNPGMEDLAYRLGVSVSTVNVIFHSWLDALHTAISGLVIWPPIDKEVQLPDVFCNEQFRKVKCIIDCTEIFIDRPTALKARAQTYSNYTKHNTLKIIIGITPSGAVSFLSDVWGGRVSDRKITLESGLLDLFSPGDAVLADRGFNMKEDFGQRCVNLIIPAFTRGKKQLSPREVEESRRMSRARIHVGRVIGRLKDFKIMCAPMPISLVRKSGTVKKLLVVISSIVNMNNPLL